MVRVRKKTSKRQTLKQRAKINKKVTEHRRKQRREAKRNPQWKSRQRQDPGIPNLFPYKEELLNDIEQQRRIAEEQKLAAREARMRGEDIEVAGDEEPAEEAGADDADAQDDEPMSDAEPEIEVMLYGEPLDALLEGPGDVKALLYVVDARDPASFRNPWLEQEAGKRRGLELVYVVNKADLVPAEVLTGWLYDLAAAGIRAFPVALPEDGQPAGVEALAAHLRSKVRSNAALVAGLQNTGKTSVATALQHALPDATVYDSPMLVSATSSIVPTGEEDEEDDDGDEEGDSDDEDAFEEKQRIKRAWTLVRNQGNVQRSHDPVALVRTLLQRIAHPEDLMLAYGTPAYGSFVPSEATLADDAPIEEVVREQRRLSEEKTEADTEQFLAGLARSCGRLKRHAVPDTWGAARLLLRDWSHGSLGYYTKPPANAKTAAKGSQADKKRWTEAEKAVQPLDPVVLPRKAWRQRWASREVRLSPGGAIFTGKLVFAPVQEPIDEAEEDEEGEDEEGEDEEGEDEEGEDEEDEDIEDEEDEDIEDEEDNVDDEDEDEEMEEEPKRPAPRRQTKAQAAPSRRGAPRRNKPAPGEAYDLNAYF